MPKPSLKKNFVYQLMYRLLTVVTPLITNPYLSRTLGAEKLGVYSGTYSYANYYIIFAILGIEFFGNRTIAVVSDDLQKRKQTFWNIYIIQFVASVIALVIYYSTIGFVFRPERMLICCLQGIWIVASGLDINWYFFGKQDFKLTVTRNIIIKLMSIVCIFVFVHSKEDLYKYVFIMAFSLALSQGVLWIFLIKDIGFCKPHFKEVKENIKPIMILFIPVLAMSVFHIMDKTMVDKLSDEANSGYYYNVDRLVNIPFGLITGLGTVMLPRISKISSEKDTNATLAMLGKSSELSLFLASSIAFGLGAISKTFVPVFFGKGYEPCILMIVLFIPIIIIKALSDFIRQQYLIPSKKDKIYVIAVICGAVINFFANFILIFKYGATGAVIGTFIAEIIVLLIEIFGTLREINFVKLFMKSGFYVVWGLIMFAIVKFIEPLLHFNGVINLIILMVCGGLIFGLLCLVYWIITKNSIFKPYVKK